MGQVFGGDNIGRLAVHVDEPGSLIYGNQVIGGPASGRRSLAQDHPGTWNQKLLTAPCVLHVANGPLSRQKNMGDEAIGPFQEDSFANGVVSHVLKYSFLFTKMQRGLERRRKGE